MIHSCDDVHELVIVLFVMFFVSSVVVEMNPILFITREITVTSDGGNYWKMNLAFCDGSTMDLKDSIVLLRVVLIR